jgi:hypothetical protein
MALMGTPEERQAALSKAVGNSDTYRTIFDHANAHPSHRSLQT